MGRKAKDEEGNVYGRLTVLTRGDLRANKAMWVCQCTCGTVKLIAGSHLREGRTTSCGCLYNENKAEYAKLGGQGTATKYAKRSQSIKKYRSWRTRLMSRYNLSSEEFTDMMNEQEGCCAICGDSLVNPNDVKYNLHIDHDHKTGEVRGLLCRPCNIAIGLLQDSPTRCTNASIYLKTKRLK